MTRTLILAAALATVAGSAFANPFVTHALESNDFEIAQAIENGPNEIITYSSKSPSVSALEVALKSAIENDDRQKAAHLERILGR